VWLTAAVICMLAALLVQLAMDGSCSSISSLYQSAVTYMIYSTTGQSQAVLSAETLIESNREVASSTPGRCIAG